MRPKISICIPIHEMKGGPQFLWDSINALMDQSFQDFEIVITKAGKMAENTNAAIKKARGEIVKILYLDDRLAHKDALKNIVEAFEDPKVKWLITGADNNPHPYMTEDIGSGNNKLGSPSALSFRNSRDPFLFDERLSWLLDCHLYKRLYIYHGPPKILDEVGVILGIGDHQMTNILTGQEKLAEYKLIAENYD